MLKTIILTATFALVSPLSAHAAVSFFQNVEAFDEATVGISFTEDDFGEDISGGLTTDPTTTIIFDSGVVSTRVGGRQNFALSGAFFIKIGTSNNSSELLTWVFPNPVTAVGFEYLGLKQRHVQVMVDGEMQDINNDDPDAIPPENGFFGFVSTNPVTELKFTEFNGPRFEDFRIDNLRFESGPVAPIPVPAGLQLLLSGLAGLGLFAHCRRRAARSA